MRSIAEGVFSNIQVRSIYDYEQLRVKSLVVQIIEQKQRQFMNNFRAQRQCAHFDEYETGQLTCAEIDEVSPHKFTLYSEPNHQSLSAMKSKVTAMLRYLDGSFVSSIIVHAELSRFLRQQLQQLINLSEQHRCRMLVVVRTQESDRRKQEAAVAQIARIADEVSKARFKMIIYNVGNAEFGLVTRFLFQASCEPRQRRRVRQRQQKLFQFMMKFGQNMYCNFNVQQINPNAEQKVRAVTMGNCGSGKTSFFNNICNTNYDNNLTRDIAFEDVCFVPTKTFRIYDTPGLNSPHNSYESALILRACLTTLPLNMIIIHQKFQNRFDQTIAKIKDQLRIFKGYEHLIVILISHFDIFSEKPEKMRILKQFGKMINEYQINHKIIIYSNRNSEFSLLANTLYKIGRSNKFTKLVLEDQVFLKYLNILYERNSLLQASKILVPIFDKNQFKITQVEKSLFVNFAYESKPFSNPITVKGIIIGNCGVGKTSFINHLCGTSYQKGISMQGLTRQISFNKCKQIQNLVLCDTPGLNTTIDSKLRQKMKETLGKNKWNMVLIMSSLTSRFQNETLPQLRSISKIFDNEVDRIIFLISHIDIAHNSDCKRIIEQLNNRIKQYKINNKIIFLSNNHLEKTDKLAKVLYGIGFNKQQRAMNFNYRNYSKLMERYHYEQQGYSGENQIVNQKDIN